jgi:ATP adenylyltransferase
MKHLWAPWRIEYVAGPKAAACVLCEIAQSGDDEGNHVLHRGEQCFVVLNRFPYNSGHVMVVPYRHVGVFGELSPEELAEMMLLSQDVLAAFERCLHPDGVNMGMNIGQAAGAGISDHLHLHIIPRWGGDTNFLTSVAETRVVPQSLEACGAQLGPALTSVIAQRQASGSAGSTIPD